MNDHTVWTEEKIRAAVAALKQVRPVYADILDLYEQLFVAQELWQQQIQIEPIIIPPDTLALKQKEFFPLVDLDEFVVDDAGSRGLLTEICRILGKTDIPLGQAAVKIQAAMENGGIKAPELFKALITNQDRLIEAAAGNLSISNEIIRFFIYNSIRPAVSIQAHQLATYLSETVEWQKGYCPVCGSAPVLAMLGGDGARSLTCSFCWHQWRAPRIFCPFCENRDSKALHYFYSEEEKEYRVDVCDKCGKYLKTIDTRETHRTIYPPLEQIATLHLDIKAKELGHVSGVPVEV